MNHLNKILKYLNKTQETSVELTQAQMKEIASYLALALVQAKKKECEAYHANDIQTAQKYNAIAQGIYDMTIYLKSFTK